MRPFQIENPLSIHEDKHYLFLKHLVRSVCNLCGLSLPPEIDYEPPPKNLNLKHVTKNIHGSAEELTNELVQMSQASSNEECFSKSEHGNSSCWDFDGFSSSGGPASLQEDQELNLTQHRRGCLSSWKSLSKGTGLSYLFKFPDKLSMGTSNNCSRPKSDVLPDPSSLQSRQHGRKRSFRYFTYAEISLATSSFHPDNLVGKGGYAEVYKGALCNGQVVAVKRLTEGEDNDSKDVAFLRELGVIGHVSHPNTSSLLGFCIQGGTYLVLPFLPHGSLASLLHGPKAQCLVWPIRYKIAVGVARGLHYLHKCCQRRIIHRDIKASNILLGPDYEPQISDFGLAKWLPEQWTHHTVTTVEGTYGYLAPEYLMHGIVDEKTDIFAFGILLLELVTGRRPFPCPTENSLAWAQPILDTCDFEEIVDCRLSGVYDATELRHMLTTATMCVRRSAIRRPCMTKVLKLLIGAGTNEDFLAP